MRFKFIVESRDEEREVQHQPLVLEARADDMADIEQLNRMLKHEYPNHDVHVYEYNAVVGTFVGSEELLAMDEADMDYIDRRNLERSNIGNVQPM